MEAARVAVVRAEAVQAVAAPEAEREAVAAAEQLLLSTGRSKMALND